MRPIDADKLKVTDTWALVEGKPEDGNAEENNTFTFAPLKCVLLREIENAPTVEITETEIQEVLNKRGMSAVANDYLVALHGKRPRGEWITVNFAPNELNCPEKSRFDFVKCPFCEVIHQGRHNFCSYCGADMREEGDT